MTIYETFKKHVVDCTAQVVVVNSVMAPLETLVSGVSTDISVNARVLGTVFCFAGMGSLYSQMRGWSQRKFSIGPDSSEFKNTIHDTVYTAAMVFVTSIPFYALAGCRDMREILVGSTVAAASTVFTGAACGYAIDACRDLTGIQASKRVPTFLRECGAGMKQSLVFGAAAASVAWLPFFYWALPSIREIARN